MPSSRILLVATLVALGSVTSVLADIQLAGCYNNAGTTLNYGPNVYQTQGHCHDQCFNASMPVFAVTKGSTCFCGDNIPTTGEVDMSNCQMQCQGYSDVCGGENDWLFGYTGAEPTSIPKASTSSLSSSSSSTATPLAQTTVIVQGAATVTATPTGSASSSGGSSKAGIAAGVVVGVVAIIALAVGGYLLLRRQRRLRAEEEYRAAVAAKEFTASIKKPTSDERLDPVMLQHRRLSDGSIADNQDFSRRILKVTNPDDS